MASIIDLVAAFSVEQKDVVTASATSLVEIIVDQYPAVGSKFRLQVVCLVFSASN